ncbi:hypothetical protein L7F22_023347 [Adiantum nelumboides]|nr:hypothetical protein [Adiantum nelumboides]
METSSNSSRRSQAHRSNGPPSISRRRSDPLPSSSAPSPPSESCIKGDLSSNNAHALAPSHNLDAHPTSISRAYSCKERTFVYEKLMPLERFVDTRRPLNREREDTSHRSSKKIRTDDWHMEESTSDSHKLALNEAERGKFSPSWLQAEPTLPATRKAENSSVKNDLDAQKNGEKERLPAMVGTRFPHKKASKTMRLLSEVRDCIADKSGLESHSHEEKIAWVSWRENSMGILERKSTPKLPATERVKVYHAKGTVSVCDDVVHNFPFILPSILKRPRSSRSELGHKKLAIKERLLEEAAVKDEETRVSGCLEVAGTADYRDFDDWKTAQHPGASVKMDDTAVEMPTNMATCKFSLEGEQSQEMADAVEGTLASSLQTNAEHVKYIDCGVSKGQQALLFNDQEKASKSFDHECEGGRACYQTSHEMGQDVLAGDGASRRQRAHKMVPDMSGGLGNAISAADDRLLATKVTCTTVFDEVPCLGRGHPETQRTETIRLSDTHKEGLLTLLANPADVQPKLHMKGLYVMENSKTHDQVKEAPDLLIHSSHSREDGTDPKLRHVSQLLSQKPESFQLCLAPPGTQMAEARYASNVNNGLMNPAGTLQQVPADTHVETQTRTQNLSEAQTQTLSEGYTGSLSFSQSLCHNPSCSLNCFSGENQELSCGGSRRMLQGIGNMPQRGWLTASANEDDSPFHTSQNRSNQAGHGFPWATQNAIMKDKHILFGQMAPINLRSSPLHANDHLTGQHVKHKDFPGRSFHRDEGAQQQALTSKEPWSKPLTQTSKFHSSASFSEKHAQSESARGDESKLQGSFGLQEIATEPITLMARMIQELPDSFLESLRSLARDLLCNFEKRSEFLTLQRLIKNRTDLTENTLLQAQHTQLEIFVALKTGEQTFVQVGAKPLTHKVLTEIFLQTRCRNVACQQTLPVDGCECKVCSQKAGFCHECMCVVCSKFDSDNRTCRWLGCDFCMHWCHADCGLRLLHIAPAQSHEGETGDTEMQYRCVACGHSTELFGFVKNAFQLFAENWSAETLTKELDCVRRIFHGSEDDRGKQLCRNVEVMLQNLEIKVDITEIRHSMLQFLNETDLHRSKTLKSVNKQATVMQFNKAFDEKAKTVQGAATRPIPTVENKFADERKFMQPCETHFLTEKTKDAAEVDLRICQGVEMDQMQSMVRLKQAEANMLQLRADEAHQAARGLQQIINVKQGKIEGDYISKYAKLKLSEAEQKRSKRFLELQALERAHRDYQNMKMRMEAQFQDLALRMGRTTRQFA